jgi:Icc-related predicted phosphoesterase
MRLLLIGDFHGKFKKVEKKVLKLEFDAVLCVGDLCNGDELRKIIFKNWESLKKGITLNELVSNKKLDKLHYNAIKSMYDVLDFLNNLGKPVYLVMGNFDYGKKEIPRDIRLKALEESVKKRKNIFLLKKRIMKLRDYNILGFSEYRNASQKKIFGAKMDFNKQNKKFDESLNILFSRLKNNRKTIMLVHDTPFGVLDLVKNKKSPMHNKHVGDKYFTKYIKKFKPLLCICGHMHENRGLKKLGKTLVINSGPAFEGKCALLDLGEKIKVEFI